MSNKLFLMIAGMVFGIVAIAHLLRACLVLPVTIGDEIVPMWVSWAAAIVTGGLSYTALRLARAAQ
jgi:hypothetical protein